MPGWSLPGCPLLHVPSASSNKRGGMLQTQWPGRHSSSAMYCCFHLVPAATVRVSLRCVSRTRNRLRHAERTASAAAVVVPSAPRPLSFAGVVASVQGHAGRLRLITHSAPVSRVCCCIFLSLRRRPLVPHCKAWPGALDAGSAAQGWAAAARMQPVERQP